MKNVFSISILINTLIIAGCNSNSEYTKSDEVIPISTTVCSKTKINSFEQLQKINQSGNKDIKCVENAIKETIKNTDSTIQKYTPIGTTSMTGKQ